MSILNAVKRLLGIKPVDIGELNRRATRGPPTTARTPAIQDSLRDIQVIPEYTKIRQLLDHGTPVVFVTGNAGTGKSTLIRYLRNVLEKNLVVVAPTGVAALNVEGVTVHSFFHFPPRIIEDGDINLVYDRRLYRKLELLIVDEVSTLRCDVMDGIDRFLRINRSSTVPFGGVQLLLIGDLFQLPPVVPLAEGEVLHFNGYASPYFFSSFSLQHARLVPLELKTVFRQEDTSFIELLNQVRIAENLEFVLEEINQKCYRNNVDDADITLTCTNRAADQINRQELSSIRSREYSFRGRIEGRFNLREVRLPSPLDLRLKIGSRVMFTKNDHQRRWVNGTLGVVKHVDENSIAVQLVTSRPGLLCDVLPVTWETYKYVYDPETDRIVAQEIGQYTQYPLVLAWAVTIHKSQGKTLERALVDLGHGAFASGQVYVALSRCRSLDGIRLKRPIEERDVRCDPMIERFYAALQELSSLPSAEETGPHDH